MNNKKRVGIQIIILNLIIIILTIIAYDEIRKNLDKLALLILPVYVILNGIFIFIVFWINENYYKNKIFYFNLWKMPNQNYLKTLSKRYFKGDNFALMSIVLTNHEDIIKIFDEPFFYKVMQYFFETFKNKIKNKTVIVSNNIRRIMVISEGNNYLEVLNVIEEILSETIYIDSIPIKLQYNIGYHLTDNLNNLHDQNLFLECYIASKYAYSKDKTIVNFADIDKTHLYDYNLLRFIPNAIENNELIFHYQPIIPTKKENYLYLEMLIRWEKDGTVIMPNEFIPQLEQTQLIDDLSLYIVKKAILDIKEHLKEGYKVAMSINVSAKNLLSNYFVNEIIRLIKQSDLDPYHFELEITEGSAIEFTEKLLSNIILLENLGVKVSIDDFGAGFSSVGYFNKMPIDYIKIDKDLTNTINKDEKSNDLVKNIIVFLQNLGYGVVGEGIEHQEQFDFLIENTIDYMQGYYISKPLDSDNISKWIKENYDKYVK